MVRLDSFISKESQRYLLYGTGIVAVGLSAYGVYRLATNDKKSSKSRKSRPPAGKTRNGAQATSSLPAKNLSTSGLDKCNELKKQGNDLFREGKYAEAINFYSEAIANCPSAQKLDLATFYQNRAAAYEKLADHENVYKDCTEAIKLNKKYTKAIRRRAEAAEKLKLYREAVQDYMKVCFFEDFQNEEINTAASRVLQVLAKQRAEEYLTSRGDSPTPLSISQVAESISSYASDPVFNRFLGDDSAAVVNGLSDDSDHNKLRGYELAKDCIIHKRYDEVVDACSDEISIQESSHLLESFLLRGTFYVYLGLWSKAESDLNRVLELANDKSIGDDSYLKSVKCNAYVKLALLKQQTEDFESAENYLSLATETDSENPDVHAQYGQLKMSTGRFAEASTSYAKAVSLKPDFVHFLIQRGTCDFRFGFETLNEMAMKKSFEEFERLANRFPESAEAQSTYAQILCDMQQFVNATLFMEKALTLAPNNPTLLVRRGVLDLHQKNIESGLKRIELALKLDPYCVLALETLAQHYSANSDLNKMNEYYTKTMEAIKTKSELCNFICLQETTLAQMKIHEELYVTSG